MLNRKNLNVRDFADSSAISKKITELQYLLATQPWREEEIKSKLYKLELKRYQKGYTLCKPSAKDCKVRKVKPELKQFVCCLCSKDHGLFDDKTPSFHCTVCADLADKKFFTVHADKPYCDDEKRDGY
jgi:hypothetical protein